MVKSSWTKNKSQNRKARMWESKRIRIVNRAIISSVLGLWISQVTQFRNTRELTTHFLLPFYKYSLALLIHHCHMNDASGWRKNSRSHASESILNFYKHPYFPENPFFQSYFPFPICLRPWDNPSQTQEFKFSSDCPTHNFLISFLSYNSN